MNIQRIPLLSHIVDLSPNGYYLFIVQNTSAKIVCHKEGKEYNYNKSISIKNLRENCSISMGEFIYPEAPNMTLEPVQLGTRFVPPIAINNDTLIKKEILPKINTHSLRNLQYEFGKLHEQINQEYEKLHTDPTHPEKINKSMFLTRPMTIGIVIAVLFILTWLLIARSLYKLTKKLEQAYHRSTERGNQTPTRFPDLNCKFRFDEPVIPRKRSKYAKFIKHVRFSSGTYDVPASYRNYQDNEQSESDNDTKGMSLSELSPLESQSSPTKTPTQKTTAPLTDTLITIH